MRRVLSSRPRRGIGAALALAAVIAVVVILILVTGSSAPSNAGAAGTQGSGATSVERRNLVQSDTESGTLSYSDPATVYDRLSGTVTWLPQAGAVIHPGQPLFEIDGEPVILMDGGTPAFRTLTDGISDGPDVLELNRNLIRLGFNPDGIVANDTWQLATTDGVEMFQDSLGEAPTGSLTLGQVVFLPGPQIISTVEGALGSTGGGGGSSSGAQSTSAPASDPAPEFVSLHPGTSTSQGGQSPTTSTSTTAPPKTSHPHPKQPTKAPPPAPAGGPSIAALTALLKAEIAQLRAEERDHSSAPHKKAPSHHSSSSASHSSSSSGDGPATSSAQAILQTTSTHLIVTVQLSASSQSEAVVGERVGVEMPNGSTVSGRITGVSPVAQSSSSGNGGSGGGSGGSGGGSSSGNGSGSSSATVPVTIALLTHPRGAGLDQASVSVNFVAQRAKNVLSVPVTALVATSGNTYAVQEAAAPHKLIPVTTGLFAAGYVQITGAGIYPGLQVTDSQG